MIIIRLFFKSLRTQKNYAKSVNDNAISKFPRAKYTASPVDQRKCEKKPKSYQAMNLYMFFDFTGPTAFWALGESKLCQQTKNAI